jgi:hypothetical protein
MDRIEVTAGFPEFWKPVFSQYQHFFECAYELVPIVREMLMAPAKGDLLQSVGRMAAAAANSYGALLTLVLNGYGQDAMKIARSIYEVEVNIVWLKLHPEDVEDYIQYGHIQRKQLYDAMGEEQQKALASESYSRMMEDYTNALQRFGSRRDPSRPRNEWCKESLYERAKQAEEYWQKELEKEGIEHNGISLHKTFYRVASSMHHMDVCGMFASTDSELNAIMAPSWEHLDDALVAAGSVIRCVSLFFEMAGLDMEERIRRGPSAKYAAACRAL